MGSSTRLRWSEIFFFAVTVLALLLLLRTHRAERSARGTSVLLLSRYDSLSRREAELERDLRHYRRIARRSTLNPSITLEGRTLKSGSWQTRLSQRTAPLLIYSIDPFCAACLGNLSFVNTVHKEGPCGTTVLGLGVNNFSGLESLARDSALAFPILREASGEAWELLPLTASPTTVVIGQRGVVHGWWIGLLSEHSRNEILALLRQKCET